MSTFRQTLSEKKRRIFDALIAGVAPANSLKRRISPVSAIRLGTTKINGKQIVSPTGRL